MNKDKMEIMSRLIFDEVYIRFLTALHKIKSKSKRGTREAVFVLKGICRYLEKRTYSEEEKDALERSEKNTIKKIALEARDYFKENMSYILEKYKRNRSYYTSITDSVEAAIVIQLYSNLKDACFPHIFKTNTGYFELSEYSRQNIHNADMNRAQDSPEKCYPENDRPRGEDDIISVNHHCQTLREGKELQPIWLLEKDGKKYILDGFHRIAASFICKKKNIPCVFVQG